MNEALLPVVNGLEFLSPPLPQEKQETLVRRVLEQGAAENLPPSCRTQRLRLKNAGAAFADGAACGPFWRLHWPCAPVQPSSVRYSILLP